MSAFHLDVFLLAVRVGELAGGREGGTWFAPDRAWLERGALPSLGVAFERDRSLRRAGTGLPYWFEHLLPAPGGALRRRICSARNLRETDSAALLKLLGRDLPGAVEVLGDVQAPAAAEAPLDLRIAFSLPGLQLKFSLAEVGDRFAIPGRGQDGGWIVKLPSDDRPELPAVEHATMRWAAAAGFSVPETRVVATSDIEGLGPQLVARVPQGLAVRRFDRRPDGKRVHQEDFAQALEIGPEHIYGNSGPHRLGNDQLLRLVSDASGPAVAEEFVQRLAFVVVSGNTDAHLKNWSFQWTGASRPQLSPLYDQVATVSWEPFGWQKGHAPELALAIGRCRLFADLTEAHVETFAKRGGSIQATTWFEEGVRRAIGAWNTVADTAPEPMRAALAIHWSRVPILRRLA